MSGSNGGRKETAATWFGELRDRLVSAFEAIEDQGAGAAAAGKFERTPWRREAAAAG